jgi:hypothetical protein
MLDKLSTQLTYSDVNSATGILLVLDYIILLIISSNVKRIDIPRGNSNREEIWKM